MERSKNPAETAAFTVEALVEVRPGRQCPGCGRRWPSDWDYCLECAVWLGGREVTGRLIRLVPAAGESLGALADPRSPAAPGRIEAWVLVLACEVRGESELPARYEVDRARALFRTVRGAVATHGGAAHLVARAGIIGRWTGEPEGADRAVRAGATILRALGPWGQGHRSGVVGVSLGLGIATAEGEGGTGAVCAAFRLASLAEPNGGLVSQAVYRHTVERFDYRGVAPPVPRADPLPGPVFELLGPKPERSGSLHVGPERAPLVGRRQALAALDDCRRRAAGGHGTVLHLIGEPGAGKSKLLREWLAGAAEAGHLAGWTRLEAHGVPYGGYPGRTWACPVSGLGVGDARGMPAAPEAAMSADEAAAALRSARRPALLLVDDLHWVDAPSLQELARLLVRLKALPALAILACRPSFARLVPSGSAAPHRRLHLRGLTPQGSRELVDILARRQGLPLAPAQQQEIVDKAAGNPLYVEEAVAHLADVGEEQGVRPGRLAPSLPQLLIQRIQWAIETALPEVERHTHLTRFTFGPDRKAALDRLESLEERLAAWLDRFDAIEEEAPHVIRRFLRGLEAIDGRLGLVSLFLGRQRPHYHRLAQALARIGGAGDARAETNGAQHAKHA